MITGVHSIVYSKNPEADRTFFRDVLGLKGIDVGDGWLIFALPPAELAVHPHAKNDLHELYLICDDIGAFVEEMRARGIKCSRVQEERWGRLTKVTLPGGGKLGVYEPSHERPSAWPITTESKRVDEVSG